MAIPEEHFNTLSESRSNKPVQRSYKSLLTRKKTCSCFLNCLTSVFPGSNSLPFKRPVHRPSNIPLSITLEETSPNLSSLIYEHHYAIAFWKTWLLQNKKDVYIYIYIYNILILSNFKFHPGYWKLARSSCCLPAHRKSRLMHLH